MSSKYCDSRSSSIVDTLIIHSIYDPDAVDPFYLPACKKLLDYHSVSCHYLIDRVGTVCQLVPEDKRAWVVEENIKRCGVGN